MKISDLFIPHQGNGFELYNMNITNHSGVNFVSRTAQNNGVVSQVERDERIKPFPAGFITVALGGSVLSSFVQAKPFYTAFHIMVLEPKKELTLNEKLFYCLCIQNNAYRYSYGRQANKTLKNIEIPDTIPQYVYEKEIKPISTNIAQRTLPILDFSNWNYFFIGGGNGIFAIENCKCSNAGELTDGNDLWYIGAKKNENGIMKRVAISESLVTKGNCIVFICDGQGSVGFSNYMEMDFIGSTTLSVGYNKQLNKYNALFIVTVLDLERKKYSYGRKYRQFLTTTKIKLPAKNNGTPDFDFMEKYIKSLQFSDRI